jgi:hypothetical protein
MSSWSISNRVVDSFIRYCNETPPSAMFPDYPHDYLADFILCWVESGHGVRACLGDYQTYLTAIPALIHAWHWTPMITDYAPAVGDGGLDESAVIERRVEHVFSRQVNVTHRTLDPDFFAECAFRELHGDSDDL